MPTSSKNGPRSLGRTGGKFERARQRVLRANQICWICRELIDLDLKKPHPMAPEVDHIIPSSQLEWDDPLQWSEENLRSVHSRCNKKRGTGAGPKRTHPQSRNWRAV